MPAILHLFPSSFNIPAREDNLRAKAFDWLFHWYIKILQPEEENNWRVTSHMIIISFWMNFLQWHRREDSYVITRF